MAAETCSGTAAAPGKGMSAEALKYGGTALWELLALALSAQLRGDDPPLSWYVGFVKWLHTGATRSTG